MYVATPEYFGVYAMRMARMGVRLLGGCCGTTPEHIRRIARLCSDGEPDTLIVRDPSAIAGGRRKFRRPSVRHVRGGDSRGRSSRRPCANAVEFASEASARTSSLFPSRSTRRSVSIHREPSLRPGCSGLAAWIPSMSRMGPEHSREWLILRLPCVFSAKQASKSCFMCAVAIEISSPWSRTCSERTTWSCTTSALSPGILQRWATYPDATSVYDVDSIGILKLGARLEPRGGPSRKALGATTRFLLATGVEPAALSYERELERLKEKKAAGAELVMTQPVYDPEVLDRLISTARSSAFPSLLVSCRSRASETPSFCTMRCRA